MSARDQVTALLKEHGATLKRSKTHEIWGLPDGRSFTRAKTPSDAKADDNNLSDLKRVLGVTKTEKTVGERREKKVSQPPDRQRRSSPTISGSLQEKLLLSGAVASDLNRKLEYFRDEAAMWQSMAGRSRLAMAVLRKHWWVRLGFALGLLREMYPTPTNTATREGV